MTKVGDRLAARGKRSDWGGLYFDGLDSSTGSVTEAEALLLYALVRAIKPEVVVEIGTSYGFSALHIAQALKDNGRGHLHTAEINEGRRREAIGNIAEAELSAFVSFYDRIPLALSRIDIAFLDGAHDEDSLREYLQQVQNARLILVHDAAWQDHCERAINGSHRRMIMLPTDSFAKLAMVA